jgi:hypothetical protein
MYKHIEIFHTILILFQFILVRPNVPFIGKLVNNGFFQVNMYCNQYYTFQCQNINITEFSVLILRRDNYWQIFLVYVSYY